MRSPRMRRLNIDTSVLVTVVLALLLIAYVFIPIRADPSSQVRCASADTLNQVKRELFRRASAIRGGDERASAGVANYAAIRADSRIVRRHGQAGVVKCSGAIVLDLPPGLQVVGGRRRLGARVSYALAEGRGRTGHLRSVSNADAIVQPLASLTRLGSATGGTVAPGPSTNQNASSSLVRDALPPSPPQPAPEVQERPAPASTSAASRPRPAQQPGRPAGAQEPREASRPARQTVPAVPVGATASVRPSFNCRYARTRGEIAVCRNPGLASLDRQMATQFYRALSRATPGARLILQRSRSRFLNYRDSCGSDACIAQAYRDRMAEISEIDSRF